MLLGPISLEGRQYLLNIVMYMAGLEPLSRDVHKRVCQYLRDWACWGSQFPENTSGDFLSSQRW